MTASSPSSRPQWPLMDCAVRISPLSTLAVILIVIFSCQNGVTAQPMATGDVQALELIATHWPNVTNAFPVPWTNWSNPCAFSGIGCLVTANWTYVQSLTLTVGNGFGYENASDVLPFLAPYFSYHFMTLNIVLVNVSYAAQSSLYVPQLGALSIEDAYITGLGDISNLHNLSSFHAYGSALTSVNAFPNSTRLTSWLVSDTLSLTSIAGNWPSSTWPIYITINNAPLLTSVPSLAKIPTLAQISISSSGITQSPAFPTSSSYNGVIVKFSDLPNFTSLPYDLSSLSIGSYTLENLPSVQNTTLTNLNGSHLGELVLDTMPTLTDLPLWVCNMPRYAGIVFIKTNLASIPECLGNIDFSGLEMSSPGPSITWLPVGLFNKSNCVELMLADMPGLIVNSTLSSTLWNLPMISFLTIPPQYVAAGIPPLGSYIGKQSYVTVAPPALAPFSIPDNYFHAFPLTIAFVANNVSINGTLPSSIGSMTELQTLEMHNNEMTGTLPPSLLNLTKLSYLRLYNNSFSGPLLDLTNAFANNTLVGVVMTGNFFNLCSVPSFNFSRDHTDSSYCYIDGYCGGCNIAWVDCTYTCMDVAPTAPVSGPSTTSSNLWWIILAAAVGGVVLIALTIGLACALRKKKRRVDSR